MCSPVRCHVCSKVTWTGCGEHVEQALAGVPEEHRCAGHASSGPLHAEHPSHHGHPAPAQD